MKSAAAAGGGSSRRRCSSSAVFFFLPVVAALALSLTDFDIYALADRGNLRFVGLGNYAQPAADAALLAGAGQHASTSSSSACRCRSACRSAPRCSCIRGWPGSRRLFRTALFAPVVTTLVAVAVIWRYLLHTRYGLLNYALGLARHAPDRLAGRSALGHAGHHPLRGVEELRLQHGHLPRRAAEHPRGAVRGGAHRRRLGLAAVPPHHAADARAHARSW